MPATFFDHGMKRGKLEHVVTGMTKRQSKGEQFEKMLDGLKRWTIKMRGKSQWPTLKSKAPD